MKRSHHTIAVIFLSVLAIILFGFFSLFGSLNAFIPHIPALALGQNTYLVVFQNNTEIRPTGGFISQYALLRVNNGIPRLEFRDVYGDISKYVAPEAPYPHEKLLKNRWYQGYTFRDANWYPDFSEASNELISFYNQTYPDQIDGVIAVNFSVIDGIIRDLGGIEVDGTHYAPEQLFEFLEHSVSNIDKHNIKALKERKSVLGTLKESLLSRMFNPLVLRTVNRQIAHSLDHKEIQLYFTDDDLQQFAEENGWAGRLPEAISGDFLYVNEANLGGAKSNRYIYKTIDYEWKAKADHIDAQLRLNYSHFGEFNAPLNTDYSGYTRVYLPGNAKIIGAEIDGKPLEYRSEPSGPFTLIGFILKLPTESRKNIVINYRLNSDLIADNHYSLTVLKQPGDAHTRLSVTAHMPAGTTLIDGDFKSTEHIGRYNHPLNKDLTLSAKTLADQLSPRIVYQKIRDLKTVDIHFNEDVATRSAQNGFNYEIVDKNVANSTTDAVKIVNVEHFGRFVILTVEGMTLQPEEHYAITLKNISDLSGNSIAPSPKIITLVQRIGEED